MSKALIGFLGLLGAVHLFLIVIPLRDTLRAPISIRSKLAWCAFLLLLPLLGAWVFHRWFRSGVYHGESWEISAAEERARSGTLSPDDRD